ncbi:hypothetical protein [Hymenobacter cellulosivorans]|uniref:Uncharacterized protein n=1 Tax=Hymenobacter cellulosivorans TaxID=2932249 RepID=A0ABY4F3T9_9BACT|nr:hypothetical protein [Hymenobacter cellulosivorans]UOQ51323.1 hypothetical protein MUN80_16335 [Hymenobacter cellulosivorans]
MSLRYVLFLGCLQLAALPGAAQRQERPRVPARQLACTIEPIAKEYYQGEPIIFRVRIQNKADSALTLVYALDGSEALFRAPAAYFMARQLRPAQLPAAGSRCGILNSLDSTDFIKLQPQASFNPLLKVAQVEFQIPQVYPTLPAGDYEITFHYSTLEPEQKRWMGDNNYWPQHAGQTQESLRAQHWSAMQRQLRRVPRVSLVSNAVRVHVQQARPAAAQLGGE